MNTTKNKIKSLLALRGLGFTDFANCLETSKQSLSNKVRKNTYTLKDIIKLSILTETRIIMTDKKTNKEIISFNSSDLKDS